MNKYSRHRKAGYSLVELLVTIVIAGIAFAAMVPLFVQAQQTGPKDKYRTTAVNLAQDRLERVRQLPFSVVTTASLLSPPSGSGLDSQLQWGNRTVDGKIYTITPSVADVDATTRRVTITVAWHEPPNNTQKQITLQTDVFRQLPGPQILSVKLSPAPVLSALNSRPYIGTIPSTGVKITAVIQPAQALEVGRVKFTIVDMSGATSPVIEFRTTPDGGTQNSFSYYWAAGTTLRDGLYRISVVAYSTSTTAFPAEQGNTRENDVWVEQSVPPPVQGVAAYAGKVSPPLVNLLWSGAGMPSDLNHFEVWRQPSTGAETWVLVGDDIKTFGFTDRNGLVADQEYRYVVRAVDNFGNAIDPSGLGHVTATPTSSGAAGAPFAPKDLKLSFGGGTMTVTWSPPVNTSGVLGYHVYRSSTLDHSDAVMVAAVVSSTAPTYAARDDLQWNRTYFYTVKAFNADGAESAVASTVTGQAKDAAGWAQYITPAAPEYQLYVQVRNIASKRTVTMHVIDTKTGVEVTGSPFSLSATSSARTLVLPYGVYTVTLQNGSDVRSTSAVLTGDPAKIVYITFIL